MAIPFTVDISAFYGEPDFREQDSGTIVDRRKTLNLHKELETPVNNTPKRKKRSPKRAPAKSAGAIGFNGATNGRPGGNAVASPKDTGGAIGFKEGGAAGGSTASPSAERSSAGACQTDPKPGGALAFNEAQLMNELTGLKKGGALGTLAATIIPALIQMAPQIISSLKSLISGKEGGALKFGGASAVFLNGINPGDYDDVLKTMKAIERQSKNIEVRGGALYAGSSRVGTFFKNAWNKIKGWYDNNADKLKPITDILVNAGTNAANNAINKGVNYVSQKTGSDTVKQLANVIGDMAKGTVSDVANQIQGKESKAGAGYDISDLDNETQAIEVQTKKKNRILTALPQNENKMHESVIRRRVY